LTLGQGNLNFCPMLQACLNGNRGRDFNHAVPLTPQELARDAVACRAAGADEFHIHPRNANGAESFAAGDIAAALGAVRASVPGVPIGVSTREGIMAGAAARQRAFQAWDVLPDYVSVNLSEDDAPEVVKLMLKRGIGIEAGLATVADAERYVALPEANACLRVLIEIEEQKSAEAISAALDLIAVLDRAGSRLPRQLHGYDSCKWALHGEALRLGLDQRIGLEDGKLLPDGRIAESNAELIAVAVKRGAS
jgi:uncharacterized protein (DUF849 family)